MTTLEIVLRDWAVFAAAMAFVAAAALAGALALARRGEARMSARSRYMLVAIALVLPVVGALLVPAAGGSWSRFTGERAAPEMAAPPRIETAIEFPAAPSAVGVPRIVSSVALLWAAGFILVFAGRIAEWIRWTRIARGAPLCEDVRLIAAFNRAWEEESAPPSIHVAKRCEEPMVVGLLDPVVLLPVGYGRTMDDDEIAAVAVHELGHVARRDNVGAAAADLLASLFWFDPFHWIARSRLLELREAACDERVLGAGLPPRAYLSALAKTSHAAITTPAVACMSGFRIRERMESIMNYPTNRSRWISEGLVKAFALTGLAVLATVIAGFAPAAIAGDAAPSGQHRLRVVMTPGPTGQILIEAEVRSPEGELVSAPKVMADVGTPVEATTQVRGRTYRLSVTPAADGSGFAKLEVLEGKEVVDTVVKSIEAPAMKLRKPAEKVTAQFNGVDVREFARQMAAMAGVPILVAQVAEGKVTIDEREIPWDEAVAKAVAPIGLQLAFRNGHAIIVPTSGPEGTMMRSPLPPPPPGYERVGGDVKPPQVITRVDPQFTEEARKERVSGLVIIEALIGEDGLVRDVKVLKGLPLGLDQAAVDAVRQWTFTPALKDGRPVAVVFNLTINFKLDAGKKAEAKQ